MGGGGPLFFTYCNNSILICMLWSRLLRPKVKIMESNTYIVALYDTEQKRLIGVFRSIELASKYLFPTYLEKYAKRISNALSTKGKIIEGTIFEFSVAVRMANHAQILLLRNNACFINQDYPQRMDEKGRLK